MYTFVYFKINRSNSKKWKWNKTIYTKTTKNRTKATFPLSTNQSFQSEMCRLFYNKLFYVLLCHLLSS